jgi:hypothetical protein
MIKDWFLGSWNPTFICVEYELRESTEDKKYNPETAGSWEAYDRFRDYPIFVSWAAHLASSILWILHPVVVFCRVFFLKIWISRNSDLFKTIEMNERIVKAKQFSSDGWGY